MKGREIVNFSVTKATENLLLVQELQETLTESPDNLQGSGVL